jgi:hypothetical protein
MKKLEILGKVLSKNEQKTIKGGFYQWHCGGCDDYLPPGQPPSHETVCVSLSDAWNCEDLGGYDGISLFCTNSVTMETSTFMCNVA